MANEEKNSEKVGEQITPQPKQVKAHSQRSRKRRVKSGKKGSRKAKSSPPAPKRGKAFQAKPFPTATFESGLPLAKAIFDHAGASRENRNLSG
ncbi:MAG: hypothetical protein MOB07_00595 [Acidobacteria bacterium]|nr:hypothetical protein [Acidobacteriota bacterium]